MGQLKPEEPTSPFPAERFSSERFANANGHPSVGGFEFDLIRHNFRDHTATVHHHGLLI